MKTEFPRGAEWRIWDLHLHTPSSFDYKDKSQTNADIIAALKAKNVSCAAITDHHEMDAVRIRDLQTLAQKEDIVIFPGMELRGDKRDKAPINLIGIFPHDSDIDYISSELLSKLNISQQRKTKNRKEEEIYVDTFKACDLIHELGGIVTVHAGNKSNSIEQCYPNALPVNIAEKLDLIEKIDIFEIATAKDIENYRTKVFPNIDKNLPLVKTSDNHNAKSYDFENDLYSWIKGDQTFEGLRQVKYEPEDRVFVGKEPPVLERIRSNKTKYLQRLKIDKNSDYTGSHGEWFENIEIDLNKELVAIIGNKGSGKSAVSDIIGVLGNTHNAGAKHANLSFLNNNKFRKKGYADNFNAELVWEDGSGLGVIVTLAQEADLDQKEKVRYLPQHYFETLTNDIEGKGFEDTLKDVIFLHIPEAQRLESTSFSELVELTSKGIEAELVTLRAEIHAISEKTIKLEAKNHPSYKKQLSSSIDEKRKELKEHNKIKPKAVKDPSASKPADKADKVKEQKYQRLQNLNRDYSSLVETIKQKKNQLNVISIEKQELVEQVDSLGRLQDNFNSYIEENKPLLEKYGIEIEKVFKATFDNKPIQSLIRKKSAAIQTLEIELRTEESINLDVELQEDEKQLEAARKASLNIQLAELQTKIDDIKKDLSKPEKDFQEYKENLAKWESKKQEIEGSPTMPDTLKFFTAENDYIEKHLENDLRDTRKSRTDKAAEIFRKKKEIIELYKAFKESIDKEIQKDKEFTKVFDMEIDVNFKLSSRFASNFLQFINKTKKGTFLAASEKDVEEYFADKELLEEEDVVAILDGFIECLECDQREIGDTPKERHISDQVIRLQGFYDFLFSLDYLKPIYELKLDKKILDELSPGEKGTLLLVFYLMIDREDIPLIIDQPEDNLDNKSVFQVLTRFIKSAKKRRQIVIVTHNPNLAVGADAEQVVYVQLDKKGGKNKFTHEVGSIENPTINARLVEILEGTMPAFDKRKLRYRNDA